MNDSFSRADQSLIGRWWWTIDRPLFSCFMTLLVLGLLLSLAGSPSTAERLNLDSFYFVKRHALLIFPSLGIILFGSLASPRLLRYVSWAMLGFSIIMLVLTPFSGMEIKGARRWINLGGFSLQATELVKPSFALVAAWLFSQHKTYPLSGHLLSFLLYGIIVGLILMQPDFGMTFIVSVTWFVQIFLAGLPFLWIVILGSLGLLSAFGAYFFLPHVTSRIDRFLNPAAGDQYQITQSLEAFKNGGVFGQGPGEGVFKRYIPDAHADFIFPVAAEEFGFFFCVFVLGLYAFIFIRGLWLVRQEKNLFLVLTLGGLISQFTLQALVNMGSALKLIPTKGMTLPFLSYGGSSLLGTALTTAIILSMTRKRSDDSRIV
jgi:cell division protein FtsW